MSSWDFHPVARWVVNGDVGQAAHGPAGLTNSGNEQCMLSCELLSTTLMVHVEQSSVRRVCLSVSVQ